MNKYLTELERITLDAIKDADGLTTEQIVNALSECFGHHVRGSLSSVDEIHQIIASLVSKERIYVDASGDKYVSF